VNRIQQADTILIVLDGMKIKRAMGRVNDVASDHSIESDIATLMPYLNLCIGRNKTVHMLITKADILRPISDYSLGKIRALLFEDESLRSVVRQLTQRAPLRLIPISSVGTTFVHFNATGNAMEKRAGVRIQRINIELALKLRHLRSLAHALGHYRCSLRERDCNEHAKIFALRSIQTGA
jgi:hypothetical protein